MNLQNFLKGLTGIAQEFAVFILDKNTNTVLETSKSNWLFDLRSKSGIGESEVDGFQIYSLGEKIEKIIVNLK